MAVYRLTDRKFSRLWRRSKDYSDHEIRWLARRRSLEITVHKQVLQVIDPRTKKAVANFREIQQTESFAGNEKLRMYAALKLGLGLMLVLPAFAQPPVLDRDAVRAIVGESAGQPYAVKLGVASAIRNRKTLRGVYGLRAAHVNYEPEWVWNDARRAWQQSSKTDTVNGAKFFGNASDVAKGTFTGLIFVRKLGTGKDSIYFFR